MRFAALVAAACAGVLVALALPAVSDRNPFRTVFDYERGQIPAGATSDQAGGPGSARAYNAPLTPPQSLRLDLGRAFPAEGQPPIEQNNQRIESLQAYTRNPPDWPPPRPK